MALTATPIATGTQLGYVRVSTEHQSLDQQTDALAAAGYFYLATSGYLHLATSGYFFMATDTCSPLPSASHGTAPALSPVRMPRETKLRAKAKRLTPRG